jgi:hypothetical protein
MTPEEVAERAAARAELWALGETRWKLWPEQRNLYDFIEKLWGGGPVAGLCHRNFGKSTILISIFDKLCRAFPNTPCALVTDTKDHAGHIADEKMDEFLVDCPEELRPCPSISKYAWHYPNGSRLRLFGADDAAHIKTLRGLGFFAIGVDEAGHIDGSRNVGLTTIIRAILLPALAKFQKTHPERATQLILVTTSPLDENHEFWDVWDDLKEQDRTYEMDLMDNPDFDDAYRAARAKESGGPDSPDFLREYRNRRITNIETMPLPNVTPERIAGLDGKPALVQEFPILMDREWYDGQDVGGEHLTGNLWGYYNPVDDTLRIAAEWAADNSTTKEIARAIRDTEINLWGWRDSSVTRETFEQLRRQAEAAEVTKVRNSFWAAADALIRQPEYLHRVSDNNNLILLNDLAREYAIRFRATAKDEKLAQLGVIRRDISDAKLWIHPRCVRLIKTLKRVRWRPTTSPNAKPTWDYEKEIGHADLLDALIYLRRNVHRRPYPKPLPQLEDHIAAPIAWLPQHRTPGMRKLAQLLNEEPGWYEED